jgi:hypothetical protein
MGNSCSSGARPFNDSKTCSSPGTVALSPRVPSDVDNIPQSTQVSPAMSPAVLCMAQANSSHSGGDSHPPPSMSQEAQGSTETPFPGGAAGVSFDEELSPLVPASKATPAPLQSPRVKRVPPKNLVSIPASGFHSVLSVAMEATGHHNDKSGTSAHRLALDPVEIVECHLVGAGGSRSERRSGASSPSTPQSPLLRRRRESTTINDGTDPLGSSCNLLGQMLRSVDGSQEMVA